MAKIAFWSVKGGVGRTSIAVVFAFKLAMEGEKVLVVDMDLEAPSLDLFLGFKKLDADDPLTTDHILTELQKMDEKNYEIDEKGLRDGVKELMKEKGILRWSADKVDRDMYYIRSHNLRERIEENIEYIENSISESGGALFLLPTRRKLNITRIDYSTVKIENYLTGRIYERSFEKRFRALLNAVSEGVNASCVVIDCRAGISDPAAVALKNVDKCVTVSLPDFIHTELAKLGWEWLGSKSWSLEKTVIVNKIGAKRLKKLLLELLPEELRVSQNKILSFVSFYRELLLTGNLFTVFKNVESEISGLVEEVRGEMQIRKG